MGSPLSSQAETILQFGGQEPPLYFWRDSTGHEIDVVIDKGLDLVPLEIKSGKTVASDFFKGLDYWKKLSGDSEKPGALIYGGDRSYRRKGAMVYAWCNF